MTRVSPRGSATDHGDGSAGRGGTLVWIAYAVFSLCMIASVASYLWSPDYFWWPLLFSVVGMAVMLPALLGPTVRAVLSAFRD